MEFSENIQEHLNKLKQDLLDIDYVTDVNLDLAGYADGIKAPITVVDYDIPEVDELSEYYSILKTLKRNVLQTMKDNGVKVELEEFEDNDTYFYIVSYHTDWENDTLTEDIDESDNEKDVENNQEDKEDNFIDESDLHSKWIAYLKSKIDEDCNSEKCYEVYWNYDDELEPDTIQKIVEDAIKEDSSIVAVADDYLWDLNSGESLDEYFIDDVRSHIPEDLEDYALDRDIWEDLEEAGYAGIDMNAKELLDRSEVKVNIMFATSNEQNYDMGSIVTAFGSWREPAYDYIIENTDILDNAMTYLIHQQGHSLKEYYQCLLENPSGFKMGHENTFIESCVDDCVNNSSNAMSGIMCLTRLSPDELYNLYKAMKDGSPNLEFSKDTYCGTVNIWAGSGGLDMSLEKPLVIPASYITHIQVEGAKDSNYTVDSIFGLVDSCWDGKMTFTNSQPDLYKENMDELLTYIKTLVSEEDKDDEE